MSSSVKKDICLDNEPVLSHAELMDIDSDEDDDCSSQASVVTAIHTSINTGVSTVIPPAAATITTTITAAAPKKRTPLPDSPPFTAEIERLYADCGKKPVVSPMERAQKQALPHKGRSSDVGGTSPKRDGIDLVHQTTRPSRVQKSPKNISPIKQSALSRFQLSSSSNLKDITTFKPNTFTLIPISTLLNHDFNTTIPNANALYLPGYPIMSTFEDCREHEARAQSDPQFRGYWAERNGELFQEQPPAPSECEGSCFSDEDGNKTAVPATTTTHSARNSLLSPTLNPEHDKILDAAATDTHESEIHEDWSFMISPSKKPFVVSGAMPAGIPSFLADVAPTTGAPKNSVPIPTDEQSMAPPDQQLPSINSLVCHRDHPVDNSPVSSSPSRLQRPASSVVRRLLPLPNISLPTRWSSPTTAEDSGPSRAGTPLYHTHANVPLESPVPRSASEILAANALMASATSRGSLFSGSSPSRPRRVESVLANMSAATSSWSGISGSSNEEYDPNQPMFSIAEIAQQTNALRVVNSSPRSFSPTSWVTAHSLASTSGSPSLAIKATGSPTRSRRTTPNGNLSRVSSAKSSTISSGTPRIVRHAVPATSNHGYLLRRINDFLHLALSISPSQMPMWEVGSMSAALSQHRARAVYQVLVATTNAHKDAFKFWLQAREERERLAVGAVDDTSAAPSPVTTMTMSSISSLPSQVYPTVPSVLDSADELVELPRGVSFAAYTDLDRYARSLNAAEIMEALLQLEKMSVRLRQIRD